jgi:hypothetical protein
MWLSREVRGKTCDKLSSFQKVRQTLKACGTIGEMEIAKEYLTTTYCWNNTLLHSAVRQTTEDKDDVALDNVRILLRKAKEFNIIDSVLGLQMRWEGYLESTQTNRFKSVDSNHLVMTPFTFAIFMCKQKAVEVFLETDNKTAFSAVVQDILSNVSSTQENKKEFYGKIIEFLTLHSTDPDINVIHETLEKVSF